MSTQESVEINEIRLSILGMSCAGCVGSVESAIASVKGVVSVEVNFADHSANVKATVSPDSVTLAVKEAGYEAAVMEGFEDPQEQIDQELAHYQVMMKKAKVAAAFGIPLMIMSHLDWVPEMGSPAGSWFWPMVALFTLAIMVYSGQHIYRGALKSLLMKQANMDTLIALGTGAAWIYSCTVLDYYQSLSALSAHAYFEASVIILAFINFGAALETRARGQTSQAIRNLIGLQPRTARVVRDGIEEDVAIETVGLGETLRVRPGEKIAVDGEVIEGSSTIDESMLTGEAIPIEKNKKDTVAAGTINQRGSFLFMATRIGRDTALAQIIKSVRQAQSSKPEIAKLADKIASVFVPAVIAVSVVTFFLWLIFAPEPALDYAFVTSMTVLVIACPCALGLATPISVMVAVGRAAQMGILIRKGDALQTAGKLTYLVLDKTGTVTEGKPIVSYIKTIKGMDETTALQWVASLESGSEHPLASAILNKAESLNITLKRVKRFEAILGQGIQGKIEGKVVLFGNQALMKQKKIAYDAYIEKMDELSILGQTPMLLALEQKIIAIISVSDPIKKDSVVAIQALKEAGVKLLMVTGDNEITAQAIAKQAGINKVYAQVLPNDKAKIIRDLQLQGEKVGMVGDGINDAPALAQANVGFAMGAGTDVAIESADIVILQNSLLKVSETMRLSTATVLNIKQNMLGAFFYNTLSIPLAAGLFYPLFGILLSPMVAGAAMAMSSVTVVSNANRLRWINLDKN